MSLNKRLHHGWIVLFKFGGRAHLEELRKVGLLFMRSSAHFSELERSTIMDPVRADRFEGTDWIFHPKRHTIDFEGPIALDVHGNPQNIKFTTPSHDIAEHTSISLNRSFCNIYCMYAMTEPKPVDSENFGFGDSFVIVLKYPEFMKRFTYTVETLGLIQQYNFVNITILINTQVRQDRFESHPT